VMGGHVFEKHAECEIALTSGWVQRVDTHLNRAEQVRVRVVPTENPIQPFSAQRNIVTLSWDPEEKWAK
jgi:hypothetical protein